MTKLHAATDLRIILGCKPPGPLSDYTIGCLLLREYHASSGLDRDERRERLGALARACVTEKADDIEQG